MTYRVAGAGGDAAADVAAQLAADEQSPFRLALTEAFATIDHDGSGKLTAENIQALGGRMGRAVTADQAAAFIKEHDKDGSGVLVFDEFAVAFEQHARKYAQLRLWQRLHASVVGETLADDEAAMLAAQVCADELGGAAAAESGISIAQLTALASRNVPC
eukprot:COSAG03_NODE_4432_length_1555_cov_3.054258_2_plen_160_part_00